MRILSLIVFVAAMVWTWNIVHRYSEVPFSSHEGLQAEIATVIEEAVRNSRPNIREFRIEKIWTETLDNKKVQANYTYSFVDGSSIEASQVVTGQLLLKRIGTSETEEVWELESAKTDTETLRFSEGIVIRPGGVDDNEVEGSSQEGKVDFSDPLTEPESDEQISE